ncbi:Ig-like domain-containing protein [Leyella stercorea]
MSIRYLLSLALLAIGGGSSSWAQTSDIKTSENLNNPERVYTISNCNGLMMTPYTSPTRTNENAGKFAFYAASTEGQYLIYNVDSKVWVSYDKAYSYSNGPGKAKLISDKTNAQPWKATKTTAQNGTAAYEFQPITSTGKADKYMNWHGGIDFNPVDNKTITVGLWQDNGKQDNGSAWVLQEMVSNTYTVSGASVTINGKTYNDGETITVSGTLLPSDVTATEKDGKFATVQIDPATNTITVAYYDLPQLEDSEPYTNAWLYPIQQEKVGDATAWKDNNVYTLGNKVLQASFLNTEKAIYFLGSKAMNLVAGTEPFYVSFGSGVSVAASQMTLGKVELVDLAAEPNAIRGVKHYAGKALQANYTYSYNGQQISIVWRAVLRSGSHYLRTEMELTGVDNVDMFSIIPMSYKVDTKAAGSKPSTIGNTRGKVILNDKIFAGLETPTAFNTVEDVANTDYSIIQGMWSRHTTLKKGETWKVSAVVGLIAQDGKQSSKNIRETQKRRSFLAYSERERAVPWRANPCYISWYELNIDRNNAAPGREYTNMTADGVLDVVAHWKSSLWDRYNVAPKNFVIDDGWDNYGTWTFHSGFPREMRDIAAQAAEMGASVGAWLGPVGGYGLSGDYRRDYWKNNGGMQLSNQAYYDTFLAAATNLVKNQHDENGNGSFGFFKFDGISDLGTALGPKPGDTGNENAEGIIRMEQYIRENLKEDIFFNTTVGTWASPFWYKITDATWRQDADWKKIGTNPNDREAWITYRDMQVYNIYVTDSPLCPINTLMTHGFILTEHGDVSKNMNYENALNELRCAFACGSGMVELYNDYKLMDKINNGKLWSDLADLIKWQKDNADVLMDAHWVGGNPWNGYRHEIYGWAAWNGKKSTLTLRNGDVAAKSITLTLREALEIPANISGKIVLTKPFDDQAALEGLTEGEAIDIDQQLTLTLPANSVFMFGGVEANDATAIKNVVNNETETLANATFYDLSGRKATAKHGVLVSKNKKYIVR